MGVSDHYPIELQLEGKGHVSCLSNIIRTCIGNYEIGKFFGGIDCALKLHYSKKLLLYFTCLHYVYRKNHICYGIVPFMCHAFGIKTTIVISLLTAEQWFNLPVIFIWAQIHIILNKGQGRHDNEPVTCQKYVSSSCYKNSSAGLWVDYIHVHSSVCLYLCSYLLCVCVH